MTFQIIERKPQNTLFIIFTTLAYNFLQNLKLVTYIYYYLVLFIFSSLKDLITAVL